MPSGELSRIACEKSKSSRGRTLTWRLKQMQCRKDRAQAPEELVSWGECCFFLGYYEQAEYYWEKSLQAGNSAEARKWLAYFHGFSFQRWLKRYHKALKELERKHYTQAKEMFCQLAGEFDQSVALFKFLGYAAWLDGDLALAAGAWRQGLRLDSDDADMNRYLNRLEGLSVKPLALNTVSHGVRDRLLSFKRKLAGFFAKKHEKKILAVGSLLFIAALFSNFCPIRSLSVSFPHSRASSVPLASVSKEVEPEKPAYSLVIPELLYDAGKEQAAYDAGYSHYLAQEFVLAQEEFRMVLGMNQKGELREKALFYLAHCYYELGDPAAANHFFTEFIMLYPDSPWQEEALYFSGLSYYNIGDGYSAKLRLRQLKALNPESPYLTRSDYLYILNS